MPFLLGLVCLTAPVPGPVIAPYAPAGAYAGHWGVDLAAPAGSEVRAPLDGHVSFAGVVAGMSTVTVESGSLKVSLSYLSVIQVSAGDNVERGERIGLSGLAHGTSALHLSTRVEGVYVDPLPFLRCRFRTISEALWLVPYPETSANWIARRHLRSAPHRPSPHRRRGLPAAGARSGAVHARRVALAEGRSPGVGFEAPVGDDTAGHRGGGVFRRG